MTFLFNISVRYTENYCFDEVAAIWACVLRQFFRWNVLRKNSK